MLRGPSIEWVDIEKTPLADVFVCIYICGHVLLFLKLYRVCRGPQRFHVQVNETVLVSLNLSITNDTQTFNVKHGKAVTKVIRSVPGYGASVSAMSLFVFRAQGAHSLLGD